MNPEPYVMDRSDPAYAGQAVYTPAALRLYDLGIVKLSNSLVWRCPARRLLEHYDRHVGSPHLDVGPGTGYYLERCRFPEADPQITLLDPNPAVLRHAAGRLRRYRPSTHAADVLKPIQLRHGTFRSVALNYVLHCLPGDLNSKAAAFDNLVPLVAPGGVIFGSTILHHGVDHTPLGRVLLRLYNRKGIFGNLDDDLEGLERVLALRFGRFEVEVTGTVARFAAWP